MVAHAQKQREKKEERSEIEQILNELIYLSQSRGSNYLKQGI